MANIKKVYEDAERTTQFYPQTHERAVVDNNGTTAETKFQMITDLVNQKQMEIGAVPIDLVPTKGNTDHVVSSDGVYKAIDNASLENFVQVYYEKYYTGNGYNPGSTNWYRGSGAHIAVPIEALGGIGSVVALTTDPYGYVCFVTSYTPPSSNSAIPFANAANVTNDEGTSSMSGRIAITKNKGTWYLTIPDNASHLIVGTKDAQGTAANFLLYKVSVEKVTDKVSEIDTRVSELEAHNVVYEINEEISLADYTQANYNMTDSGWYSVGKHKTIPISDLGGAGTTIALSTTDPNNTYCAFFYNYTTPSSSSSPVYFVKHPNTVKHNGTFTTPYFRIGLYNDAKYNYITIPSDAVYLIINTVDGVGVDAGVKLYTTTEKKLDYAFDELYSEVNKPIGTLYEGEKISLKKHGVRITRLCKTPRCQGIWYRNEYFFNCELITNKRFELYHYESNSLVLKAYWGLQDTVGATFVSSSQGVHANSMQMTNIYYSQSDEFPIFTVGGNMGDESGKMYVMRLYKDGNDTWQLTKLYDVQGENWGIFALEDGTIAELANHSIRIFSKKITAENTGTINVTSADIVYTYSNYFTETSMPQDMVNYGNKLFLLEGDSHSYDSNHNLTEPGHLMLFDFVSEKCVNDIQLIPLGITIEPEGIDIDNEVMYIAENGENNNGYLWKLEFD